MKKILSYLVITLISIVLLTLFIIGSRAPETSIYLGSEMPKSYLTTMQEMGLLEEGEKMEFFYSDGFWDIRDGMYWLTDRHLGAYIQAWEEPKTILSFEALSALRVEYDSSFFEDSFIEVEDENSIYTFPISSEKGRDRLFVTYLEHRTGLVAEETILFPEE